MSTLAKPFIRPSASLIIAAPILFTNGIKNDGSNYKILMMKRNAKSSFVNAHVYPGGVVDEADNYLNWCEKDMNEKEGDLLTNKICAIRETFEESGLLLSNPPAHTIKDLNINIWRDKVHKDAAQFKVMCKTYNIRPATNQLVPFSNWITPIIEKKRYDAHFFLTVLEGYKTKKEQDLHFNFVTADGEETVLFEWLKPEEGNFLPFFFYKNDKGSIKKYLAIEQQKEKKIVLIPPQWYSLSVLKEFLDYRDLKTKAGIDIFRTRHTNEIITILPQSHRVEPNSLEAKNGFNFYLAYPGDESYESKRYTKKKGNRHRLYFKGRMEEYFIERNVNMSNVVIQSTSNL
ncbi:uncharacterized protein BX663DRAFT_519068 [Cokeromyces recurvatus]|uniref:uncharacterized protein n=1 Tax=Cokeromyces recurvatus TaxID=90255 RepID=UPI00221F2893|nr:uncharacterized protein BX663DRAFT_519068 [Cokeromyces recurvatus]KAI7899947.1 hypothetical protein BX663DRAFT_519068 [Cokeromyces recurvatus]